ncbi:DUF4832 domain-containing protein [Litorilinea aerophila]|uniref:DUF4832 domain-containing protein n=1 Tax=Litorilinea aerophila TaxID=1204385 RepID=A0A540VHJ8_9CHLR|nr:DUF4832 domain-containing protein [Litorilinea aerophila]MCC9076621.1 DUF4832 domain-containing protein [Litorilinea aerophila]
MLKLGDWWAGSLFMGLVLAAFLLWPGTGHTQAEAPVLVGAGDIAHCSRSQDEATAQLLDGIAGTVFTLGDNAYPDGTLTQFQECYGPGWGRHKGRTRPAPGNHDYHVPGAAGYYTYFGEAASPLDAGCTSDCKGYYSYDLGDWHIIVLNSEIDRGADSPQVQWLRADLAANPRTCTLAYWHKPRFSSGRHGNNRSVRAFWEVLYEYGADVVLSGHDHTYERFAPQDPEGQADPARGIRQFVVGTGGASLYSFSEIQPNSEVRNDTAWGVLKLTLHPDRYDWEFIPATVSQDAPTFTDAGSANCVGNGSAPTVTPTAPTATPAPVETPSPSPEPTAAPTVPPPTPSAPREVMFVPSDEDFPNPERGFMRQKSIWPDQGTEQFSGIRRDDPADSLVWIYFRLDNYRDRELDAEGLSVIRGAFQDARQKGLKLVIRFIYNWGPGWTDDPAQANPDVPIDLALRHIEQLAPILAENADVIAALQAGFVGHWGEWHSSRYLHPLEYRRAIVDALLAALPADRPLQLRYPRYKELFYGGPLTSAEAFSGTDASRVGHHNDCFLRDDDDTTYRSTTGQEPKHHSTYCDGQDEIACWKEFVAQEGLYTPIGGETCQYNPPRTDCPNALAELEMLHWSFINNGYRQEVLDGWRDGGCMETIRRRLGYRLVLNRARFAPSVVPGSALSLEVALTNVGFAPPYNPRPVFVVLMGGGRWYELPLPDVDPRRWTPGAEHLFSVSVAIPAHVVPGTYRLALWLPDPYESLRQNPAYSIRFANEAVWDEETGLNVLASDFQVAPGQGPLQDERLFLPLVHR